jgi:hypothetical protein
MTLARLEAIPLGGYVAASAYECGRTGALPRGFGSGPLFEPRPCRWNDCLEVLLVCEPHLKAGRWHPGASPSPPPHPGGLIEARHKSRARMAWADLYSTGGRRRSMARPLSALPLWTVATAKRAQWSKLGSFEMMSIRSLRHARVPTRPSVAIARIVASMTQSAIALLAPARAMSCSPRSRQCIAHCATIVTMTCLQVLTLQQIALRAACCGLDRTVTPRQFRMTYGLRCWRALLATLGTRISGARFQSTPTF